MAKSQTKETYGDVKKRQDASDTEYSAFAQKNNEQLPVDRNRMNTQADDVYGAYKDYSKTGGIDPSLKSGLLGVYDGVGGSSSGSSSGGSGGSSLSPAISGRANDYFSDVGKLSDKYGEADKSFDNIDQGYMRNLAETGGVDMGKLEEALPGFRKMQDTGGVSDADMNNITGNGVFKEFSETGGYTDKDKANIRSRAISPIGSLATGTAEEMARRRAVQGGYSPGYNASNRALLRDTGKGITDASLGAELGIKDAVNTNRMAGASALSTSQLGGSSLKTGNQLAGTKGIADVNATAQSMKQAGLEFGAAGLADIQKAVAEGKLSVAQGRSATEMQQQQTDLATASGRTQRDIATLQMQAAAGNASAANALAVARDKADNMRFLINSEQQGTQFGLGGMAGMSGQSTGQYNTDMALGLDTLNSKANANSQYYQARNPLAMQPGGFATGAKMALNAAAPIAASFMGMPPGMTGGITGGFDPSKYAQFGQGYFG